MSEPELSNNNAVSSEDVLRMMINEIRGIAGRMRFTTWLLSKKQITLKSHERALKELNSLIQAMDNVTHLAEEHINKES